MWRKPIAALAIHTLSKAFGATKVLDNISLEVTDGEFCVLLGPSGCGKTTLLRLVAGLEAASNGSISIGERRVDDLPPRERDVAFVFQNYALYPHMSVFDNLAFSLRLRRLPRREIEQRVSEAARLLEIEGQLEQKPQQLSGGQRQRVALGRAIVRQPKIFLFDEPLSNLDATLRGNMRVELARLHEKLRATIVYVTHDQAEAMTLGEKVVVLNHGKIQQIGKPSAIYLEPVNTFVAGFVGHPQMNFISGSLDENARLVVNRDLRVDMSEVIGDGNQYVGEPLTVGVRPEDLYACDLGAAWVGGTVEFVEDLGSDRFVHLACRPLKLVVRISTQHPIHRGDTLHLRVEPQRMHIFYQDQRINLK